MQEYIVLTAHDPSSGIRNSPLRGLTLTHSLSAALEAFGRTDAIALHQVSDLPLEPILDALIAKPTTRGIIIATPTNIPASILSRIRATRKDIYAVACVETRGARPATQYAQALALCKRASINLALAFDTITSHHVIAGPELARYGEGRDRDATLLALAHMIASRSMGTFTRTTVIPGSPVSWQSEEVPASLRHVVNHCIDHGAYKPFLDATAGHFAARGVNGTILTSRRGANFNQLSDVGLVRITPHGTDEVIAEGGLASVGGQSQRIVFANHPDDDYIVHAHVPLRPGSRVPVRPQWPYECGSHECGRNTSDGLGAFGPIKAVMLEGHGPNIVFPRATDPAMVIAFIQDNFDLAGRTDGEIDLAAAEEVLAA